MTTKKPGKKQGILIKEEVGYQPKLAKGDSKKNNGKKEKK